MNNRTRWLYLVVPLLVILFIGAAAGMARIRTPGASLTHSHEAREQHDAEEAQEAGEAPMAQPYVPAPEPAGEHRH